MRQHQDPDDFHDEDLDGENLDDEFGRPVYQGTGLSVRALTAAQLQRFLDAHAGQPAQFLGSGWAALDPPAPLGVPGPHQPRPYQCRPSRSPAATAAPAALPSPNTGGAGRLS